MKSARTDANTARQKFSSRRRPPSWGNRTAKIYHLEMVTTCTYRPSLVNIDARNFELLWQQTQLARSPQTLSARCKHHPPAHPP